MKARTLLESFTYAIEGVLHTWRTQRNFRLHVAFALLAVLVGYGLGLERWAMVALSFAVGLVLVAELFNTALEAAVDLATDQYHPLARQAKNAAAGAVLLAAAVAVVVGYLLFFERLAALPGSLGARPLDPADLPLAAVGLVVLAVIAWKAGARPFRLQGGMPSGHTAVAFALAAGITILSHSGVVSLLGYLLALTVGESRIESGIHSWGEVLLGAVLGTLLAGAVFYGLQ